MKKIITLVLLLTLVSVSNLFSQVVVSIQPDQFDGFDAIIQSNDPFTNFGNVDELVMTASHGEITRSLIQFSKLEFPQDALIEDASLFLAGATQSNLTPFGNSQPNNGDLNDLLIERIIDPWDENLVTWYNQPKTDVKNSIPIPSSSSIFGWSHSANVTDMIIDMFFNPMSNFGFMIKLNFEGSNYGNTYFMSSDYSGANFNNLRPTLTVTYSVPDFEYSFNSNNQTYYTFSSPQKYASSSCYHEWKIDGVLVSNNANFSYQLTWGDHTICHTIRYNGMQATKCINICL